MSLHCEVYYGPHCAAAAFKASGELRVADGIQQRQMLLFDMILATCFVIPFHSAKGSGPLLLVLCATIKQRTA